MQRQGAWLLSHHHFHASVCLQKVWSQKLELGIELRPSNSSLNTCMGQGAIAREKR